MEVLKQINLYNLVRLIIVMISFVLIPLMILNKAIKKVKDLTRKVLIAFNLMERN